MNRIKKLSEGKIIAIVGFLAVLVMVGLALAVVNTIANWFDNNELEIKSPVVFTTQRVVNITPRKQNVVETVNQIVYGEDVFEIKEGSVEEMILDRWGREAPRAIAVFKAESGLRCHAFNVNKNGTVDVGVAQINSIHYTDDFTIADAADCEKNLDKAYEMWEREGWSPWVAYLNGSYLAHL